MGATSGMGREAAFPMAAQGASLTLVARDEARGEAVASEIAKRTGSAAPVVVTGDLSDADSIRACVAGIRRETDRLAVLVNNAGIHQLSRQETPDGIERVFAMNVLGYHLLAQELLPLLERGQGARIVNVASTHVGELDFDDLEFKRRPWNDSTSYKQSKQADQLWTQALARRLRDKKIVAIAMSPGLVDTGLYRNMKGLRRAFMTVLAKIFGRTVAQGADTITWLALSPEVEGKSGLFYVERNETDCLFRGDEAEERMWSVCEEYDARRRRRAAGLTRNWGVRRSHPQRPYRAARRARRRI